MEQTWQSVSKRLNEGILTAVTELRFEQMTPVQVKCRYIALCRVQYDGNCNFRSQELHIWIYRICNNKFTIDKFPVFGAI